MLAKELCIIFDLVLCPFPIVLHDSLEIAEICGMLGPSSLISFLSMYSYQHIDLLIQLLRVDKLSKRGVFLIRVSFRCIVIVILILDVPLTAAVLFAVSVGLALLHGGKDEGEG